MSCLVSNKYTIRNAFCTANPLRNVTSCYFSFTNLIFPKISLYLHEQASMCSLFRLFDWCYYFTWLASGQNAGASHAWRGGIVDHDCWSCLIKDLATMIMWKQSAAVGCWFPKVYRMRVFCFKAAGVRQGPCTEACAEVVRHRCVYISLRPTAF